MAEHIFNLLPRHENLTRIASWADEIKRRPEYRFTSSLHYVNPKDDEPHMCRFDYQMDCPEGRCIVGAIFNYSKRADPSTGLSHDAQVEALKFLVHYVGDIHQPLHGNLIHYTWSLM